MDFLCRLKWVFQTHRKQVSLFKHDRQTTTDLTTSFRQKSDKLVYGSLDLLAPEWTVVKRALCRWCSHWFPSHASSRACCRWRTPGWRFQWSLRSGSCRWRWAHNLWEDCCRPMCLTPHSRKCTGYFSPNQPTWKMKMKIRRMKKNMRETVKSAKWRVEERSEQPLRMKHGWRDADNHLEPMSCATLKWVRETLENVTCEGVLFTNGTWSMLIRSRLVFVVGNCFCMFGWVFADRFLRSSLTYLVLLFWFGEEWNTSITKWQRSRAGIPSMREPASREMISASVEKCETEVCFLNIQLVGANVWLPKMHKSRLMLILSHQSLLQNQNLEIILFCTVVLCFPHSNIAGTHLCDECTRSNASSVCHKLSSIWLEHEQICSKTTKISGLPIRAKYKHFRTICEQTVDNSPTDSFSSS